MRVWGVVNVMKKVEILSYSPEYKQGILDVMRSSFFPRELFCKAAQIAGNRQAEDDLLGLVDDCLSKSKVSMVAKDVDTGKVVGASVNLIQTKPLNPNLPSFFETFRDNNCKTENAKALMNFMIEADSKVNIYEKYGVSTLFEMMFMAALPEYSKHGIGGSLGKAVHDLAIQLRQGVDCDQFLEPGVPAPPLIATIATSASTQKFCRNLNGDLLVHEKMSEFSPKMKKFVANLDDPDEVYEVLAKKI